MQGQHEERERGGEKQGHEDNSKSAKELTHHGKKFLTKVINWNDNDSSSDENNGGSNEKDKKPAAKKIPTVIIWRVRTVRRATKVSFPTQAMKKD